jgi:hypothetical protein
VFKKLPEFYARNRESVKSNQKTIIWKDKRYDVKEQTFGTELSSKYRKKRI